MTLDLVQLQICSQCDENRLLQCYGFHSEANDLAIADIKAIARNANVEEGAEE